LYTVSQIATVIKAKTSGQNIEAGIEHILLDSRKLLFPATSVFFALNGPRHNGNLFMAELYDKGVCCFVVDEELSQEEMSKFPKGVFLQVPDVLQALQLFTAYHRQQFNMPVIGITGSNGKTIVKEWLYQLLQQDYIIIRSPKSYNSQIGVPLSVWQMNERYTLGIFEAGISQPDEMQKLAKIINPTIGVFTSIGEAHGEGFLNVRQKINEKLKLFVNSDLIIYCADEPDINEAVNAFNTNVKAGDDFKLLSWSKKNKASLQVIAIGSSGKGTKISALWREQAFDFEIPFSDSASVENAITCCCVLLYLEIDIKKIKDRMKQLRHVEMRLELKQGINNCSIINDSYSADINSLTIALDFLHHQQQHAKRTLILSDILQSGKSGGELYALVAAILEQKNINRFIGIGPEISKQKNAFKNIEEAAFFSSTAEFRQQFHSQHFYDETILLKGARVFEFEHISHYWKKKHTRLCLK